MTWWQAIILGVVQGAAEFLPVSSSGHLILVRYWTGLSGDFLLFDATLHLATLVAVVIVLRKDILALWKPPFKVFGMIIVASVPAVITGFFLQPLLSEFFSGPRFLWIFFFITALLLLLTEMLSKRNAKKPAAVQNPPNQKPLWTEEWRVGMAMGMMQAVAILPGISRSGSTIFGGVAAKGSRESVAKFSFLLSIPIILGALLFELYDAAKNPDGASIALAVPALSYFLGITAAFTVGLFAIKFMLKLIAKANFKWFSLYLGVLGAVTLVVHYILGL